MSVKDPYPLGFTVDDGGNVHDLAEDKKLTPPNQSHNQDADHSQLYEIVFGLTHGTIDFTPGLAALNTLLVEAQIKAEKSRIGETLADLDVRGVEGTRERLKYRLNELNDMQGETS